MYQLQLTTSQVGLQDILDHGGAASSVCASSLPPNFSTRPHWGLVPGRAERHLAKPQKHFQLQTAWCSPQRESRPKVEELTKSYRITLYISLKFMFILIAVSSICSSVKSLSSRVILCIVLHCQNAYGVTEKVSFLKNGKQIRAERLLNCATQSENGRVRGVKKRQREQQLPFLSDQLTWKATLCLRLEAITLGVRFKTFVCQHDRREQGCNLMRGQREWETRHGQLPTEKGKEKPLSVARTWQLLAEKWMFTGRFYWDWSTGID